MSKHTTQFLQKHAAATTQNIVADPLFIRLPRAGQYEPTSRSLGLRNSERSQNVSGSGANPSEVKKPSPYLTICFQSVLRFLSRAVTSYPGSALAGAISG